MKAVAPHLLPFEALRLRVTLRTHDAAYLALALDEDCPLYTMDERFFRNAAALA